MFAKLFLSVYLLLLFSNGSLAENAEVVVQLNDGKIKGKPQQSSVTNSTTTFYSFLGVRYAKPPVGHLRFQPPQPVDPWKDIYDATYEKNVCYQLPLDSPLESEDCLFLNIFTPQNPSTITNNTELLPVMLFIHGGGFVQGYGLTSGIGGPDFFMDYDVILVSINYRLGPFGFLSTGDTVLPGNNGLKDQSFAIKWTKENIKNFGGDPEKITIFGQSSGSASVGYHLLSPKSKGLFRSAICESGVALTPWAYQRNQTKITYATAGVLNDTFNNVNYGKSTELLAFLLNSTAEEIDQASKSILNLEAFGPHQILQGFFYAPVVEVDNEDAFITELMFESLEKGNFNRVPVLMGLNAEESVVLYSDTFNETLATLEENPSLMVPDDMHLVGENVSVVADLIKAHYLEDENIAQRIAYAIKFFTDHCFARSILKQAELQSRFSDVYLYVFTYHGVMGGNLITYPGTDNVAHSEELPYMFVKNIYPSTTSNVTIRTSNLTAFSKEDLGVHYRFMKLWTNFAKFGNPTPRKERILQEILWPKVNLKKCPLGLKYLDIGVDLNIKRNPRRDAHRFWDRLYKDYAVRPYDTY